jgi:hypothetical protein
MMSENYFLPVDAEDKFVPNLLIFRDFCISGFTVEIDKNHIQQVVPTYKIFWSFSISGFSVEK